MDKDLFILIGKNIKKYRELKNYTIEELAIMTNIDVELLKKYEKEGVNKNITFEKLNKICDCLEINIKKLFT